MSNSQDLHREWASQNVSSSSGPRSWQSLAYVIAILILMQPGVLMAQGRGAKGKPNVARPPHGVKKESLPAAGSIIISEFRFRGPGDLLGIPVLLPQDDEFVEIYNNTDSPVTVTTADGSLGWALVAADGNVRFIIPLLTVIPARAHYLGTNSLGYSLATYPAGSLPGLTTPDITYTQDIPDGSGIALFRTANPANFTMAERLDAAGYASVPALYREGTGFPTGGAEMSSNLQYSFARLMSRVTGGRPQDTDDNAADFIGVDTAGTATGQGQYIGAPGPENLLFSPVYHTPDFTEALLDPAVSLSSSPNRDRDYTSDPANLSPLGTLTLRRTYTNHTGSPVTRLRFRIVEITNGPSDPALQRADLRVRDSTDAVIVTSGGPVNVRATTLEVPPAQPLGGGWNSSIKVGFINLLNPLPDGQSVSVQFLLGVQQTGHFQFWFNIEAERSTCVGPVCVPIP